MVAVVKRISYVLSLQLNIHHRLMISTLKYRPVRILGTAGLSTNHKFLTGAYRSFASQVPSPPNQPIEKPKSSIWDKVKHEVNHYWDGTKLLGLEMKISFRLLMKTSAGHQLSRRETLQLRRTTQDVVRLVPFSAFVLVPFAELLLPIALKLFPNLLPSTYESNKDKLSKLTSLRKTRGLVSGIIKEQKSHFKPGNITDEQKLACFQPILPTCACYR